MPTLEFFSGAALCIVLATVLPANGFSSHCLSLASSASSSRRFTLARNAAHETKVYSTVNAETISSNNGAISLSARLVEKFLSQYETSLDEGRQWADEFGFEEGEGAFYAIFRAIRKMDSKIGVGSDGGKLLGLDGTPFYVPASLLARAESASGEGTNKLSDYCFHFSHLETALEEDFLDATVGSTDNRKGWQVSAVSQPTGSSFDDARMTLAQVKTALTVRIIGNLCRLWNDIITQISTSNSVYACSPPSCPYFLILVWNCHIQQYWSPHSSSRWAYVGKYRCVVASRGTQHVRNSEGNAHIRPSSYRPAGRTRRADGRSQAVEGFYTTH